MGDRVAQFFDCVGAIAMIGAGIGAVFLDLRGPGAIVFVFGWAALGIAREIRRRSQIPATSTRRHPMTSPTALPSTGESDG